MARSIAVRASAKRPRYFSVRPRCRCASANFGVERQRCVVARFRLLETVERGQRVGAVEQNGLVLRHQRQRAVVIGERVGVAAEVLQQHAAVDEVGGRLRIERQRALEAFQRLGGAVGVDQDIGAVAVGVGEVRIGADRGVEILQRLERLAQPVERLPEQVEGARVGLAEGDGAARKVGALLELPRLAGDQGDAIERLGVFRVGAQHLRVALHRLLDLALAVVELALLQQLLGGLRLAHAGF